MAADGVFALILFYSFVIGARRGFYKEVVQLIALIVAILAAKAGREPFGAALAAKTNAPLMLAEVAAVVMVWIAVFFITAIVGRLILKKLRGKGLDDNLDEGAEQVADALGGDTSKGPFTLLTDPIASKNGLFYWSDKILGGGLGFLKGTLTGYLLFGLILYADRANAWDSTFARQIEESVAARVFTEHLETTFLSTIPEYRIARSLDDMRAIGEHFQASKVKNPERFERFVNDPRLKGLRDYPAIQEVGKDPEVQRAWADRDVKALLGNPKVRALLSDADLRRRLADVEWEALRKELEAAPAPTASPAPSPDPDLDLDEFDE